MSIRDIRKKYLGVKAKTTVGEMRKAGSDITMEYTWDYDEQSKPCFIYDYYHDDQPDLRSGMTYDKDTTKTPIDAKFIIATYPSATSYKTEYHIQFKPSQKLSFDEDDPLYYYQTDYVDKYGIDFPIGLYIDIPDDKGVYKKYLICAKEHATNHFAKFIVLPVDYLFRWIEVRGAERIKRQMWGCLRGQQDGNEVSTSSTFSTLKSDIAAWMPLNTITDKIYFTEEESIHNQRLIVSATVSNPAVYRVSGITSINPVGILKFTLARDRYNTHTDYGMYADYCQTAVPPVIDSSKEENETVNDGAVTISNVSSDRPVIKLGGSWTKLQARFFDSVGTDLTDILAPYVTSGSWTIAIDGVPVDTETSDDIQTAGEDGQNILLLKIGRNRSYIGKVLTVTCSVIREGTRKSITYTGSLNLEIMAL